MKPAGAKTSQAARKSPKTKGSHPASLTVEPVEVNEHCTGSRWAAADTDRLARIVAIIAMGQASHAARIISELLSSTPAIDHKAVCANAKRWLTVAGPTRSSVMLPDIIETG